MASGIYRRARQDFMKGVHDLTSNTVKVLALNSSYTYSAAHAFVSDVSANELSGTGYSRQTLGSKAVNQDATNDRSYFTAANFTFTSINAGTIAFIVVFRDRAGADSANEVLCCIDVADLVTNGNSVISAIDATDGLFYL
jgi:hypothetical protein